MRFGSSFPSRVCSPPVERGPPSGNIRRRLRSAGRQRRPVIHQTLGNDLSATDGARRRARQRRRATWPGWTRGQSCRERGSTLLDVAGREGRPSERCPERVVQSAEAHVSLVHDRCRRKFGTSGSGQTSELCHCERSSLSCTGKRASDVFML